MLTAIRSGLAAVIASAAFLLAGHLLAPVLAPSLPGQEALSAALGLLAALTFLIYKLLIEVMTLARLGRPASARSRVVSAIVGGGLFALVSGAFLFCAHPALGAASVGVSGAPAAASLVRTAALHLPWLKAGAEALAALFIGSWIGRRHGRAAVLTVFAFALVGWMMALSIDVLCGLRSLATVRGALRALQAAPTSGVEGLASAAHAAALPLLAVAFCAGLVGCLISGRRRGVRAPRTLVLGAA